MLSHGASPTRFVRLIDKTYNRFPDFIDNSRDSLFVSNTRVSHKEHYRRHDITRSYPVSTKEELAKLLFASPVESRTRFTVDQIAQCKCMTLRCKTPELVRKEDLDACAGLQLDPNDHGPSGNRSTNYNHARLASKELCRPWRRFSP